MMQAENHEARPSSRAAGALREVLFESSTDCHSVMYSWQESIFHLIRVGMFPAMLLIDLGSGGHVSLAQPGRELCALDSNFFMHVIRRSVRVQPMSPSRNDQLKPMHRNNPNRSPSSGTTDFLLRITWMLRTPH